VHAFQEVRTRKTFEEAIHQIADAVRVGDLREGDRLPSERTLAAQMRISRPSLREALKLLSEAGVLEVRPGGGTFVHSEEVPPGLLEARSQLRVSQVAGVLEARRLIEPRVAQLASLRADDDDYRAMEHTIELQRESTGDRDRFLRLDHRFHLALARSTGNATVVRVMDHILGQLEIVRDMALYGHVPEWSIAIHERTVQAVQGGDLAEIETVMSEHLSRLESVWREEESAAASARWLPDFLFPARS